MATAVQRWPDGRPSLRRAPSPETSAPDSPYVLASELDVRWCALGWYFQLLGGPEKRADCKTAIYDSFIRPALEVDLS